MVLEAEPEAGGRVRSSEVDGFVLDRGFQVLPTAYPELRRVVDLEHLELGKFGRGIEIRLEGRAIPLELGASIGQGLASLVWAGLGRPRDVVGLGRLLATLVVGDEADDEALAAATTEEWLASQAFSPALREHFWRPFLGGITLDRSLGASALAARAALRALLREGAALPRGGAARVTRHLASRLAPGALCVSARVHALAGHRVVLEDGGVVTAELGVVVATEGPEAARLLGGRVPDPGSRSVRCLYFRSPAPVVPHRLVMVDGAGGGPATNAAQVSNVVPAYAPPGWSLLAVSVPGPLDDPEDAQLVPLVREQLRSWFGAAVTTLELIDIVRIAHGQPARLVSRSGSIRLEPGVYVAGDYCAEMSINGALASGRRAARALLDEVDPRPRRRAS